MRISTNELHFAGVKGIKDHQQTLYKLQEELSSGRKVLTPGDDPVAMDRIMRIQKSLDTMDQYETNGDFATNRLTLSDRTLNDVTDVMQRTRELIIQGKSGTYTAENRALMAAEVRGLIDHMNALVNTQDFNGEYIYAGHDVMTTPFSLTKDADGYPTGANYNGASSGARYVQIAYDGDGQVTEDDPARIKIGDNGNEVFEIDAAGGGTLNILQVMINVENELRNGNPPTDEQLTDVDSVIGQISEVQTDIGTRITRVEAVRDINESVRISLKENLSDMRDVDFVEGITQFQLQSTALQTAQQVYSKLNNLSLFNYL